jgi:hypothetical protein
MVLCHNEEGAATALVATPSSFISSPPVATDWEISTHNPVSGSDSVQINLWLRVDDYREPARRHR